MEDQSEVISVADMKKFVIECFITLGTSKVHSGIMADTIVGADMIGHGSHGVFRLEKFLNDVQSGNVDIHTSPKIEKETSATAWIDGMNGLGPVVGNFCMKVAIEKAKETGASIVVANNSNNFGVASHYSKQALEEGMIGLAFTNSSSLMLSTRSKYSISGTNPISVAAPGLEGDYYLLDMATTVSSGGNVQMKYEHGEYLPVGWAVNAACISETNADVALKTGRFLPLGSREELGSYKGAGLSLMVDILCGILGGAAYGNMVGVWNNSFDDKKANVGHCFIAINPDYFAPDFEGRMSVLMSSIKNAEPVDSSKKVRVAGDKGREMTENIEQFGGIRYPKYVIDSLQKLSEKLKVKCVSFIPKTKPMESSLEELPHMETENMSFVIPETEEITSFEQEITITEYSADKREISFVVQDSSEWLCPITDAPDGRDKFGNRKQRLLSIMTEKTSKRGAYPQSVTIITGENNSVYSGVDEIVETQKFDLPSPKLSS